MLNYNIYTHINDQRFLEIETRLICIEKMMIDKLVLLDWKLTQSVKKMIH